MPEDYPDNNYDYFEDDDAAAEREERHRLKIERVRAHKNAYIDQETQKELRKKHPGLQEAWERYQTILKLVDNA